MSGMNGFHLVENEYHKESNKSYEGLMAQGNGYFHVRASFEEGLVDAPQNEEYMRLMKSVTTEVQRHPLSKYGTYLPTVMGSHPSLGEVIINLPYFMGVSIAADGEDFDMLHSELLFYNRTLDLKTGHLTRRVAFETKSGCELEVIFERFCSMTEKHLFCQRVSVRALRGSPSVHISAGIDADVTTNGYRHFASPALSAQGDVLEAFFTTDLSCSVLMQTTLRFEEEPAEVDVWEEAARLEHCFEKKLNEGESFRFCKYSALGCSRDQDGNFRLTVPGALKKSAAGYDELKKESDAVWEKLWEDAGIMVEGDDRLQFALHFAQYHLMRCNTGLDPRVQVCAKGFAGEAYYGRYFWDSEIYLLPFYLYSNPKAARSLLLYRYHTLPGARENAARYHCRGARYPWQSSIRGDEQCSLWEYADNEVHITADVAFALMHYVRATKDYEFLRDYGLEILLETARFWLDRIDRDENGDAHLLNVMGPDEYSPMTRDNAYTVRFVQFNLQSAAESARLVKKRDPAFYEALAKRLDFADAELSAFHSAAASLKIPIDKKRKLVLQSADFESFAPIDINAVWKDRSKPFGFFATQEKIYRSRCLKQADVIALMTLFPQEFTDEQVKAAYDYYMPLTTHDSSLSPAGHSIVANRLGRTRDVDKFLHQTIAVDLGDDRRGAEDGIHIANCGCLWQLVVFSFCGISPAYQDEELKITPRLPKTIDSITVPLYFAGRRHVVVVDHNGVTVDGKPY